MALTQPVKITFVVLLLLLAARIAAPEVMVWYVNSLLQRTQGISGQVQDIDLAVWRGGYDIKQIEIFQHNDKGELPLFSAERLSLQLSWVKLLQGEIVTTMAFYQPVIMALDRTDQTDITEDAVLDERTWIGLANDLTLFSIDSLTLHDGRIEFNAIAKDLLGELILSDVNGEIRNLHNDAESELLTDIALEGTVGGSAPFFIRGSFNPNVKKPSFDINMQMEKLPTEVTDSIVKIYAPFDVEAGEFELAAELASDNGQVNGYVKAGIYQLEVFSWKEDVVNDVIKGDDNPLQLFVEAVSAALAMLLENGDEKLIATRIPIKGNISDPDTSVIKAIKGLFYNAFVQAYQMKTEDIIDFTSVASDDKDQAAAKNSDKKTDSNNQNKP